jgi:hypothetical protein
LSLLLLLLFCSFVVFLLLLNPFMSTEFRNILKQETHFSNIAICTSYLGARIAQSV